MFSDPFCCISIFEALFMHTNGFKIKYSYILEHYLLLPVFNSKKVQLVKKSFPYLINVLWINVFNLLTTGDQISFQIGCSVEESVTIRASKGLDYCIDVAHVAYLTIVPQQPDSFPVVLDSPTSEFIFSFAIHNVYYMKGNFQVQKVLNNWKIFHRDPFQLREGES